MILLLIIKLCSSSFSTNPTFHHEIRHHNSDLSSSLYSRQVDQKSSIMDQHKTDQNSSLLSESQEDLTFQNTNPNFTNTSLNLCIYFKDISLLDTKFGLDSPKFHKNFYLFPEKTTIEFENMYPIKTVEKYFDNFDSVIKSDVFIDMILNFVYHRQEKKFTADIERNPDQIYRFTNSYLNAKSVAKTCVELICLFNFNNLRDFIYYFTSVLLFTFNFQLLCIESANTLENIANFPNRVSIDIFENGFQNRKLSLVDLCFTKRILLQNILSKGNYSFEEFLNYIFNSYFDGLNDRNAKKDYFILLFRFVYLEIYMFFINYRDK